MSMFLSFLGFLIGVVLFPLLRFWHVCDNLGGLVWRPALGHRECGGTTDKPDHYAPNPKYCPKCGEHNPTWQAVTRRPKILFGWYVRTQDD